MSGPSVLSASFSISADGSTPSNCHAGWCSANTLNSRPPPAPTTNTRASAGARSASKSIAMRCRSAKPGTRRGGPSAYLATACGSAKTSVRFSHRRSRLSRRDFVLVVRRLAIAQNSPATPRRCVLADVSHASTFSCRRLMMQRSCPAALISGGGSSVTAANDSR